MALATTKSPFLNKDLLKAIDHTNLNPDATTEQIQQLCDEAIQYGFGAVCVAPSRTKIAADKVSVSRKSKIHVASVVGFPHGNSLTEVKALETKEVMSLGASEIDMVMAIGHFLDGDYETVYDDINRVVRVAERGRSIVKVILETYLLREESKIRKACDLAVKAGAKFVKTSTGFLVAEKNDQGAQGLKLEAVKIMRKQVVHTIGVKAAGGISDLDAALRFLDAGASRLGCSSSVNIARELVAKLEEH